MLHKKIFPLFLFLITAITVAQNKEITLEEIEKNLFNRDIWPKICESRMATDLVQLKIIRDKLSNE